VVKNPGARCTISSEPSKLRCLVRLHLRAFFLQNQRPELHADETEENFMYQLDVPVSGPV
jgi:hypothetical protein